MKFRWDKKYLHWGVTAFFTICASILFYYLIFHSTSIKNGISKLISMTMPVIVGFILAYLLNPLLNALENRIFIPLYKRFHVEVTDKKRKTIRNFALILTMIIFLFLLYGFFSIVIPELINSIQSIILQFPVYVANLISWSEKILSDNAKLEGMLTSLIEKYSVELEKFLNTTVMPQLNTILKELSLSLLGFFKFLWNFLIGIIISIYVLKSKEHFAGQSKKIVYALFEETNANNIISDFRFIDRTFGGFISGKLIDSLIIGVLCFICMGFLNLPYQLLISVIIGITNIIPFFGPYLGAIPSTFLILVINPMQALIFVLFILVLQQIDGNFIGPKILGDSTGLSSFWVIFSITIFGGFFGILGMAVGVPIFAVFYAFIKRKVNRKLTARELPIGTGNYIDVMKVKESVFIPLDTTKKPKEKKRRKEKKGDMEE